MYYDPLTGSINKLAWTLVKDMLVTYKLELQAMSMSDDRDIAYSYAMLCL